MGQWPKPWPILFVIILANLHIVYTANSPCVDSHVHCAFWASHGECQKNPDWMHPNCRRSCKQCDGGPTNPPPSGGSNPSDPNCPNVQVREVQTRFVPTDAVFRQQSQQSGCAGRNQDNICSRNACYHKRYRTFDGSCNNLNSGDVMRGAAYTEYIRLVDASYADGVGQMKTFNRPNPRAVTNQILRNPSKVETSKSAMLTSFAQFIMHDITKLTLINVCNCGVNSFKCANIPPDFNGGDRRRTCVPFTRATAMCGTGVNGRARTPVNENTAFIDGSAVYGSDPSTGDAVRFRSMLKFGLSGIREPIPPSLNDQFQTGDDRANLFIGLLGMHTVFLRLHNRLAMELGRVNPHWNSDRIYQVVRKIEGSIIQAITYNELAPAMLGQQKNSELIGSYQGYDPNVVPAITVEFSGGAGRLHGLIQEFYPLINERFQKVGQYSVIQASGSSQVLQSNRLSLILRGFIQSPAKSPGRIGRSMTELLFGGESDMSSINIQRGRDLGLNSYNTYRQKAGLPKLTSFTNWPEVLDPKVRTDVARLYKTPDDIDLYVGGLLEEPQQGSLLGPTFTFIYADQLKRLRDGDRFFYKNEGIFTKSQRDSIDKVTLARVLCEGGDFTKVPRDVFSISNGGNLVDCHTLGWVDLKLFKE